MPTLRLVPLSALGTFVDNEGFCGAMIRPLFLADFACALLSASRPAVTRSNASMMRFPAWVQLPLKQATKYTNILAQASRYPSIFVLSRSQTVAVMACRSSDMPRRATAVPPPRSTRYSVSWLRRCECKSLVLSGFLDRDRCLMTQILSSRESIKARRKPRAHPTVRASQYVGSGIITLFWWFDRCQSSIPACLSCMTTASKSKMSENPRNTPGEGGPGNAYKQDALLTVFQQDDEGERNAGQHGADEVQQM